jgi:tyrosine-protein kinase Etk/Wzc
MSSRFKLLLDSLARDFDVVVVDTPPLAAGIDAYAIAAATGRILMVLRMGHTNRRLASTKLAVLDHLPVDMVGAVLNEVPSWGEFRYYSYASGYTLEDTATSSNLPALR